LLTASRPIVHSNGEGPIAGTMIVGRWLDEAFTQSFKEMSLVNVRLHPIGEKELPLKDVQLLKQLTPATPYNFEAVDDEMLRVSSTFPGISSRAALLVQVDVPRDISARGRYALLLMRWLAILAGFMILFLVTTALRRMVTGPLGELTRHVTSIGQKSDLASIVPSPRSDEVGTLTANSAR